MEVVINTAQILTTDGIPLKQSLKKAERKNKLRAFLLVFPLLLFIIVTFVMPIGDMLLRSVDDSQINTVFPNTFSEYKKWDKEKYELPSEDVYKRQAIDFMMHASSPASQAEQAKYITYGPMRASGIPIIQNNEPWGPGGIDIMPHMPNTPERLAVSIVSDPQWWSDYGAEINERYSVWMGN